MIYVFFQGCFVCSENIFYIEKINEIRFWAAYRRGDFFLQIYNKISCPQRHLIQTPFNKIESKYILDFEDYGLYISTDGTTWPCFIAFNTPVWRAPENTNCASDVFSRTLLIDLWVRIVDVSEIYLQMDDQVQDPDMNRIHCWWSRVIEVEGSSRLGGGGNQWYMLIPCT